jgi:hypothetical protein
VVRAPCERLDSCTVLRELVKRRRVGAVPDIQLVVVSARSKLVSGGVPLQSTDFLTMRLERLYVVFPHSGIAM